MRQGVAEELAGQAKLRRTRLLKVLGIASSSWYRPAVPSGQRLRPGPAPQALGEPLRQAIIDMATAHPWYGYKRIAVMCRRCGQAVKDRHAYAVMRAAGLLQRPRPREPELYQAARLFELLPQKPNDLWQMDVTYIHIPGHGWWYAVTVIDYYSRYLLACRLTNSYSALEVSHALVEARQEAERCHGPLVKPPFLVTDNGPSFLARRFGSFIQGSYQHVRIKYRTPQQLGLLERFHQTLKTEEVYWRIYTDPVHARGCLEDFRVRNVWWPVNWRSVGRRPSASFTTRKRGCNLTSGSRIFPKPSPLRSTRRLCRPARRSRSCGAGVA